MDPEIDRGTIASLMAEALRYGRGHVIWTSPPRLEVDDPYDILTRRFPSVVREILAVAALLREQAAYPGSAPFLTLVTDSGDGCLTCGDPVVGAEFRCLSCALAVDLALDRVPRDVLARPPQPTPDDEARA